MSYTIWGGDLSPVSVSVEILAEYRESLLSTETCKTNHLKYVKVCSPCFLHLVLVCWCNAKRPSVENSTKIYFTKGLLQSLNKFCDGNIK